MKKPVVVLFALLIAASAVSVPIWLAIQEARRQALGVETAQALAYARTVSMRADAIGGEVRPGIIRLSKSFAGAPCSGPSIDEMRRIDLGSSHIELVGFVRENRIVCSSIGGAALDLYLGPSDWVTARGVAIRNDVRFPLAPQRSFLVIEIGGFAAAIHREWSIDVAPDNPDVSLATLSLETDIAIISRGHIDRRWLQRLGTQLETTFVDGGHIVAVVRSPQFLNASVAAVPTRHLEQRSRALATRIVLVGLVAGAALLVTILFLARQQMAFPAAIKSGVRRDEFFLEYQPIVDLRTGRWAGIEALLRWRRPEGEVVGPDLFIPVAEQSQLIVELTQRVLCLVAKETRPVLAAHPHLHVGINVSPADLHAKDFPDKLRTALRDMAACPANLMLEITERGLLDPAVARETTGALRRNGFAIAIDDFGTGYSSLSYLETLELDYLKIDRSFIEAIGTEAPISQVVEHIIRMAQDLGLTMIAEGVENDAQAAFLHERGVELAQGWLFGKPMPIEDLLAQMDKADHGSVARPGTIAGHRSGGSLPAGR